MVYKGSALRTCIIAACALAMLAICATQLPRMSRTWPGQRMFLQRTHGRSVNKRLHISNQLFYTHMNLVSDYYCTRRLTCMPDQCVPMPTLPPTVFKERLQGIHIQFWGDSVSAQMECDLRSAVCEAGVPAFNLSDTGSIFPTINSSSEYVQVGCPWSCLDKDTSTSDRLLTQAKLATHIVINIGNHYQNNVTHLVRDLSKLEKILSKASHATVIVRSQSMTHFPTPTGAYDPSRKKVFQKMKCRRAPIPTSLDALEKELRSFTQLVNATFLDVTGLSDDYRHHPDVVDQLDCLHVCQTCPVLRSWNSLLLSKI